MVAAAGVAIILFLEQQVREEPEVAGLVADRLIPRLPALPIRAEVAVEPGKLDRPEAEDLELSLLATLQQISPPTPLRAALSRHLERIRFIHSIATIRSR